MWTCLMAVAGAFGVQEFEALDLDDPRSPPAAIVNGQETSDWPEVFTLAAADPSGYIFTFCSGTLVHAEWGITAAHCVEPIAAYKQQGMTVYAAFGGAISSPDLLVEIEEGIPNPDYSAYNFTGDIAVVRLAEKVKDITPMIVNDEPIDDTWIGTSLTFVGFGVTSDAQTGSGIKRETDIPVSNYDQDNIYSFDPDTNVCNGDSGGASLERGSKYAELAAVNAFVTPSCNGGSNGATRVDINLDFVLDHIPSLLTDPEQLADALNDDDVAFPGMGVDGDLEGVGARFGAPERFHEDLGCATGGRPFLAWWPAILILRRQAKATFSGASAA